MRGPWVTKKLLFIIFFYYFFSYLFFYTVFTIAMTPYAALSAEMTLDFKKRNRLTGTRMVFSLLGTLLGGILADRLTIKKLKYLYIVSRILNAMGIYFLMMATSLSTVFLFTILYGLGLGLSTGSGTPIRGRFFGRKAFSTIQGAGALITLPVNIVAPIYIGWVYDVTGSYSTVFTQAVVMLATSVVVYWFYDPPDRKPDVVSSVDKFM